MKRRIAIIHFPLKHSRCTIAASHVQRVFHTNGFMVQHINLHQQLNIDRIVDILQKTEVIILVIPPLKISYTKIKYLLEQFPSNFFEQKTVVQMVVGGTQAHLSVMECCLTPIVARLGSTSKKINVLEQKRNKY
ncbi:hypothetical protein [Halalkalibacter alkalisediminis]|uniref:NADPH-dependent FMN reductase-like domain-containing protein n=1 Tax=Halalkalibacter alkalisediminis TaxID=935616 RepID=A0ABV6NFE7_9BACI|nr:hypothetical protein [Halalkalibacter alkalisediminis]